MSHALLAPSSTPQWRWCAGSVSLSFGIGDEDTDASRDGTAAHWVGERILHGYIDPDVSILTEDILVGQAAENGVIVDEEMYDGAYTYARDILDVCNQRGLLQQLHIEQRVTMPDIHEHCWGTPDCWAFDAGTMTLYLWDFKYGHGSVVAYENWQLICYALGILHEITNGKALGDHSINIVMRIAQPRCFDGLGAIREWKVPAIDLRGYVNQLKLAAKQVFSDSVTCTTGPWCKNCDGSYHCPAINNSVAIAVDHSADAIPINLTNEGVGYRLSVINRVEGLIKALKTGLEAEAEHRIRKGELIPGFEMTQGYGNNAWVHPEEEVVAMGELMGVDLLDKPKLLTPAKAITALKKNNVDAAVISSYYDKKPTSMKLVVDDITKLKRAFSTGSI